MKPIPGFEGRYAITEDGKVWSYPKYRCRVGKFLSQSLSKNGYWFVSLCKNGKVETCNIHRLVALTYLPNPRNYPVAHHIDCNQLNNHVSNLMWCTHSYNLKRAYDDGLCPVTETQRKARIKAGEKTGLLSGGKKIMQLTKEGILCRIYKSCCEAAKITGLSKSSISECATGKIKTCGSYGWKYL